MCLIDWGYKLKTKKIKETHIPIEPISAWSVTNYGIPLYLNVLHKGFTDGCSLDVEDDERNSFVGIGLFEPNEKACYWYSNFELAKQLTIPKFVAHNGRSDLEKLQKWGFPVTQEHLIWDTQLMAHTIDSSRKMYGLKHLVKEDLGGEYPHYEDLTGKKSSKNHTTLDKLDPNLVSEYNACDCYWTYKLYEKQKEMSSQGSIDYSNLIEKPISFIFQAMENRGLRVDLSYLRGLKDTLGAQRRPLEASITNDLGSINLNSPKQLLEALNAKEIYPELKGKKSTDKRALERFRGTPIIDNLLRFSELETLLSSFVNPYLERGQEVVHPSFHQTGTRTGRPSCSNPNLLQIPRRTDNGKLVRSMFIAREGCLLGDCDFGQIEPRVLAHMSKDKSMLRMFNDGIDFHSFTAERLFGSDKPEFRERAKILNLSVGYRASFKSVAQQLKCSFTQAQKEIDKWWGMFPELYDWQQSLIYESKQSGYLTTLFGRRVKVRDLDHGNGWRRDAAERQLINNITQGSAAEIMKKAMISVSRANIDILVQVYDELLIESPEEGVQEEVLKTAELMKNCVTLEVPLTVDAGIGRSWNEAKA